MQVKMTPVLSSRASAGGVVIHKKEEKMDCDVAGAPRNDNCGHYIQLNLTPFFFYRESPYLLYGYGKIKY